MWTRQGADEDRGTNGDAEWLLTGGIELKLYPELQHLTCICLGERSRRLLVMESRGHMYTIDLETGVVEEVTGQFQGHAYNRIVPVEIDWPRLSRLN
jgi:hypothetical protein